MAQIKKKKKFIDVEMPSINKKSQLFAYTIEELEGRHIKYDLTRILKRKRSIYFASFCGGLHRMQTLRRVLSG